MTSLPRRHRRRALRVHALAPLVMMGLTACQPPTVELPLAELPGLELVLVDDWTETPQVLLSTQREGQECYRLREPAQATLNGEPLQLASLGGGGRNFEGYGECYLPRFVSHSRDDADWPPRQRSEVIITDGTTTLRAVFLDIDAKRTVRVNGQEAPVLHAGDSVSLEWQPSTDSWQGPARVLVSTNPDDTWSWKPASASGSDEVALSEGGRINFTLGSLPPGNYTLSVSGKVEVGVEACEGPVRCTAAVWPELEARVPVVVQ